MRLAWLDRPLAVVRLDPASPMPEWATLPGPFLCSVRTEDELSLVCDRALVPEGVDSEGPFEAFRVAGRLDLSMVGVLASLLVPLAERQVSVFVVSTVDTDYVLVRAAQRDAAASALAAAGHELG